MVKVFAVLIVLTVTLFGYQNCSKNENSNWSQQATNTASGTTVTSNSSSGTVVVGTASQSTEMKIYSISVNSENQKYKVDIDSGYFILNLSNFHLFHFSSESVALAEYCLNENFKQELQLILSSTDVCSYEQASRSSDQVCAEVINPPYAEIKINDEQFLLGFQSNACGDGKVDICEDQKSAQLKDWQTRVLQNLSQQNCN